MGSLGQPIRADDVERCSEISADFFEVKSEKTLEVNHYTIRGMPNPASEGCGHISE
jgi:hypothetical protein